MITLLILKRGSASRSSGQWRDDYDVLENGVVVGRIFKVPVAPEGRPWMWASGHDGQIKRAAYGYAAAREAAMAAFAKSWRRQLVQYRDLGCAARDEARGAPGGGNYCC